MQLGIQCLPRIIIRQGRARRVCHWGAIAQPVTGFSAVWCSSLHGLEAFTTAYRFSDIHGD